MNHQKKEVVALRVDDLALNHSTDKIKKAVASSSCGHNSILIDFLKKDCDDMYVSRRKNGETKRCTVVFSEFIPQLVLLALKKGS